jgi:c-di-AMP phosphodiesterase-like protein
VITLKNFFRDSGLVLSVIVMIAVTVLLAVLLFREDETIFWFSAPILTISVGFVVGKTITVTRKGFQYSTLLTDRIWGKTQSALWETPIAAAVVDSKSKIIWFNRRFSEDFPGSAVYGADLENIVDSIPEDGKSLSVQVGRRVFNLYALNDSELRLLYLIDITRRVLLETAIREEKPVVMVLCVDGYAEMLDSLAESERARVLVGIDKLLEDYMSATTGIIKKTGTDRITVIMEQRHADLLIADKVPLLDKAREISVSERQNVSLSIGIGLTGKTLAESERFARQALEMAQGRGGDQAAIKTDDGFNFFGGVSRGVEKQNRVRTRVIAGSLIELAESSDAVYIMGHKNSDLDSIGSSAGLTAAMRSLGRKAYAVADVASSLAGEMIAKIEDGGERMFITPAAARSAFTDNSLLVVTDTHNPKLVEDAELLNKAKKIVVIDHHRKMVGYISNAIIFFHEVYASSASEMVTELIQYFGSAGRLTPVQAEALLAGIMLDTKNFTLKTGVRTFEAAAYLRKLGADTVDVRMMFSNTLDNYRLRMTLINTAVLHKKCAILGRDEPGEQLRLIAPQAADEMLNVRGVDASFVLYAVNNSPVVYVSARSFGSINVQIIMEALGGGGHQTMAGAQLYNTTMEQARARVIETIDQFLKENVD